jgi:YVTN family beta-propeller protein
MILRRLAVALATVAGLLAPTLVRAPAPAGAASTCNARAFVANNGDGNLSVLDAATDTVVGSTGTGRAHLGTPLHGLRRQEARE